MSKFIPDFVITNRQGFFLAKNNKTGRNQLRCKWVRDRKDAEHFSRWIETDNFRMSLPLESQDKAWIIDQLGDEWLPQRAQLANVFHSLSVQPVTAS